MILLAGSSLNTLKRNLYFRLFFMILHSANPISDMMPDKNAAIAANPTVPISHFRILSFRLM